MTSVEETRRQVTRDGFRALNRVVLPAVKAGIGSPLPLGAGLVVLQTTGRSSGLPRQVPLVCFRVGSKVAVSTVRSDSQWIKNLEANPKASLWVEGREHLVTATVEHGSLTVATFTPDPQR